MAMRDFDQKKVDSFKKAVAHKFDAKGNGLHAGKFRDNHVVHAASYMKHDERCVFYPSAQQDWPSLIEEEVTFEKRSAAVRAPKSQKLSDPTLTLSNVLEDVVPKRAYGIGGVLTECLVSYGP